MDSLGFYDYFESYDSNKCNNVPVIKMTKEGKINIRSSFS
jgi:hypothetical protein